MAEPIPLLRVRLRGLRFLQDTVLDIRNPVTVMVGANGSGKSQVLAAFEILGRVVDGQGLEAGRSIPSSAELEIWMEPPGRPVVGYRVHVDPARGIAGTVLVNDTAQVAEEPSAGYASAAAPLDGSSDDVAHLVRSLKGCRVHHFDDTGADAAPKQRADLEDNSTLAPDGSNLAAVLLRVRNQDPACYQRIVRAVRTVAPHFSDFVLEPTGRSVQLQWQQNGLGRPFSVEQLGGGTLRFMCLAVLLLQDRPPGTIVLDEPELGLHPFAIHQAAVLMKSAGRHRNVLLATQSVTLLNQFDVDQVVVAERSPAGPRLHRPNRADLEPWLADTPLGELWEKNLLGGRPHPDDMPPPSSRRAL